MFHLPNIQSLIVLFLASSKDELLRFDQFKCILSASLRRYTAAQMNSAFLDWSRRSFLKAGIAATAVPIFPRCLASETARGHLPEIPKVGDLAGSRLVHAWRDLYQSPTAQNQYGYVQASKSVAGLTALSLPPFACCGIPDMMWSPGFLLTCEIFLNERILLS